MRSCSALTALLLVAASLIVPPTAARADGCDGNSTEPTAHQSADRRPVVFVHGWTVGGEAMQETGEELRKRTGGRIQPFYFDYGRHSTTWAADDTVAGCLATYIAKVSTAYSDISGGDGKIILVAHSMGGLASLYAARSKEVGERIGGLITFGTPYLGSPFGNTGVASAWQKVRQELGDKAVPPVGSNAQTCLSPHKNGADMAAGCVGGLPPYLPAAAGVTAIAGDITVKRSFGPFHLYDIPLDSDGIVPVDSQHGYLHIAQKDQWPKGQQVRLESDSCTITNDSMMRTVKAAGRGGSAGIISALLSANAELQVDGNALDGLLEDRFTPGLVVYLGVAVWTAGCSHLHVTGHGPALDHATDSLHDYLHQLEPGTAVRNLAPVTSAGEVASGWRVVDGGGDGVDCSFNTASPAARSGNIYYCSPDAEMADACWVEAGQDSVLCLSDPTSRQVVRKWMEGAIGAALPTGPAEYSGIRLPIRLDLDNGAQCRLRTGGSWGIQESNPSLVGFYRCGNGEMVWAGRASTGIDQSGKTWTVRAGKERGGLTKRRVRTAYYVATA
ncbi:alpha/beta fold hydrolase [Couchioplanes azureus]|uniref:alpha/beta fold hydrolase n=1 Tax=Couchioplanes caeruleus TaxID=56438 RepID=UPI001670C9D8|nr:alpha/beta fold hydrolase [Couchioplanes caeruleus]GGQ49000.1 hypothetical protein GCM10010166_16680 [Couchioplanes caeruleus subsp. azureus]